MRRVPIILLGLAVGGLLGYGLSFLYAEYSPHDYGPNAIPLGLLWLVICSTIFGSIAGAILLPVIVTSLSGQRSDSAN